MAVLWVGASLADHGEFGRRELRVWVSVPLIGVAALITAATPLPLAVRTLMSTGALRAYAEGHDPNPPHYLNAKWIGAFHVKKVWRNGTAVAFATDGQPFITRGVIYAPDGLPSAPLPMEVEELLWARYTHLYGPWYQFEMGD